MDRLCGWAIIGMVVRPPFGYIRFPDLKQYFSLVLYKTEQICFFHEAFRLRAYTDKDGWKNISRLSLRKYTLP